MAPEQGPNRLPEVGPGEGGQGHRGPASDLGRAGFRIPGQRADVLPPAWHVGHRSGVDPDRIREALDRARKPGSPRLEVLEDGAVRPPAVGLVPGSFDPLTWAHAALADALDTDLVLLVYSPATLAKEVGPGGEPEPPLLSEDDRIASLLAYAAGRRRLGVALCSHGLLADQAEAAASAFPGARLVFGVGSDKVIQIFDPSWYRDRDAALDRLFTLAEVAYAIRSGDQERVGRALAANGRWRLRLRPLPADPAVSVVSSRTVRAAVRRGEEVSSVVPGEVLPFVTPGEGSR
jgi:nicotinic acid mononucleotide adenylyltransferase